MFDKGCSLRWAVLFDWIERDFHPSLTIVQVQVAIEVHIEVSLLSSWSDKEWMIVKKEGR